jgi:DNA polymerase III epsilon subunit-like protein
MLSLAFVKYTSSGREVSSQHHVVYPDNFEVKSTEIHGITPEYAMEYGKEFKYVYDAFVNATKGIDILVAHNSQFDENVLFSECYRRGFSVEPFKRINFVCTLDLTKKVFLRNMKLGVLYQQLFGEELAGAHDALNDSRGCGKVYKYLRDSKPIIKNIGIPKIILKASDVAGIIGRNYYKPPLDIANELWSKYMPDSFVGKTKEQIAVEAIHVSSVAQELLKDASQFKSTNSSSVEQKFRAISNQLEMNSGLGGEKLDAAREHIRKTLYTNHGIRHEKTDENTHEDLTFYTYDVCTLNGTVYQIVGRIDGIHKNEDGTNTIIEIKNRTKGLFRTVRDYEDIQCQTYMEMLNIDTCCLIEQYDSKRISHSIQRDRKQWNELILPGLVNFCERFHDMLSK